MKSIRLDEIEIAALLDEMDARDSVDSGGHRLDQRFVYRKQNCVVKIENGATSAASLFSVPTRNLSAGGIAFLHNSFVYPHRRCEVQLISSHGSWEDLTGTVARCQHVRALIHEVAIQFDRKIDVGVYCPGAVQSRVLLADADPLSAKLIQHMFSHTNTDLTCVDSGPAVQDRANDEVFDIVLIEMEMSEKGEFDTVRDLRKNGYSGRIVAVTSFTSPEEQKKCLDAGCNAVICKPITRDMIVKELSALQREPLFSTFAGESQMAELINQFVEQLLPQVRAIEKAYFECDAATLVTITRRLKGSGGSYGFAPITDAATVLEAAVANDPSLTQVRSQLDNLISYCSSARPSSSATT